MAKIPDQDKRRFTARQLAEKARETFNAGRGDTALAMSLLATAFPCMVNHSMITPFDALEVAAWVRGGVSHGESVTGRFLLYVWNRHTALEGTAGAFQVPPFDFDEALGVWDPGSLTAFAAWAESPWYP